MVWWSIWSARNGKLWNGKSEKSDITTALALSWWLDISGLPLDLRSPWSVNRPPYGRNLQLVSSKSMWIVPERMPRRLVLLGW
ncbi:hypothetical protein ACFX13_019101 [Malus domestica]